MYWYHGSRMINYEAAGSGVSVRTNASVSNGDGVITSTLTIRQASPDRSGNYTCRPSNAEPASIQVFVSEG